MEKVPKKDKNVLPFIWIERIPLLQVYFSYFTVKQGTIFKDICIKEGTQVFSVCSSNGKFCFDLLCTCKLVI